jgi:hypothetical protein
MKFLNNNIKFGLQATLTKAIVLSVAAILPAIGFCQPPGPGDGGGGGNPDGVPFDANLNLVFLAAGLLFVSIVVVKQLKKRKTATA